jgi:hypothetical protein
MTPLVAPAAWRDERIWSITDPSATALGKAFGKARGLRGTD